MPSQLFRTDLQKLARVRLREARKLLWEREYSGSYHFSGLAVECGLKACIAKTVRRYEFPDKKRAADSWSHKLEALVSLAGLTAALNAARQNPAFDINWTTVVDWTVESRYEITSRTKAQGMYSAISARTHGVMGWIRTYW